MAFRMLNGQLYCPHCPHSTCTCVCADLSLFRILSTSGSRKINSVGPIHDYTCITIVHNTFRFQIFIFYCLFAFCNFYLDFLTFYPKYNNPKPFHDTLLTMLMLSTFLHHRVRYGNDEQYYRCYLVSIFTNTQTLSS